VGPLAVEDFFTYHRLPLLRGNVAYDKGVKIPLGYAVSPFKKGEQNPQSFGQPLSVKGHNNYLL
jgi:hypothetical protein